MGRERRKEGGKGGDDRGESGAQGLKKHCSDAMNATGAAGVDVNVHLHVRGAKSQEI